MNKIYNNLTIDNLIKTDWFNQFDGNQKKEILKGLEDKLDVSWYANPDFSTYQMREIRYGLEEKLDVSWYVNPKFYSEQMKEIRKGLHFEVNPNIYYAKTKFSSERIPVIIAMLKTNNNLES